MLRAVTWVSLAFTLSLALFFAVAHIGLGVGGTALLSIILSGVISSLFVQPEWQAVVGVVLFLGIITAVTAFAAVSIWGEGVIL